MATQPLNSDFDPTTIGATPVTSNFDPTTIGAVPVQKGNNFLQNLVADPIGTLIAKPAIRMVQAGADVAGNLIGGDFGKNLQTAANQPMDVPLGIFGTTHVEPQKAFGQGGALQIGGDAFKTAAYLAPGGEAAEAASAGVGGRIMDAALGGAKVGVTGGALAGIGNAMQADNPTVGSVAQGGLTGAFTGGIGGIMLGGALGAGSEGVTAASDAFKATKGAIDDAGNKIFNTSTDVLDSYNRAVKPSVAGKNTSGQAAAYNSKVGTAIDAIVANKPNLKFATDAGTETGRLPQTLQEFSDAITQSKQSVYAKYSALEKASGQSGASVDLMPITSELDKVIDNKALAMTNPEAIRYATALKTRLENVGQLDPETAGQVIQNYNEQLKSFYRNPSYESASKAAIDAGVANNIRKSLDATIESSTGNEYQPLKDQYGALKTIEADVQKRAIVNGRKNQYGLLDYSNILSGGDIASGILTLNPLQFAKGVAEQVIKGYIKKQSDPDGMIARMFTQAEKSYQSRGGSILSKSLSSAKPSTAAPTPTNTNTSIIGPDGTIKLPTIQVGEPGVSKFAGLPTAEGAPKVYTPKAPVAPATEYEPYVPPEKLPVIDAGTVPKTKSSLPTIEGKAGVGTLLGLGGAAAAGTALSTPSTTTYKNNTPQSQIIQPVDTQKFMAAIAKNETGIVKGDTTKYVHKNSDGTRDIGTYGVNENTLKTYAKAYLGKSVTMQQFKSDPKLQEQFVQGFLSDMQSKGITDPAKLMALWHNGWSRPENAAKAMKIPEVKKYVDNGTTTYGGRNMTSLMQ